MVRLGEVGTIITGSTPKTSNENNYSSDDLSFFKPGDINENRVNLLSTSENYVSEYARPQCRVFPSQSILVTCIGIIGKIGITTKESTCNQQINAIIPNKNICSTRFLAYAISQKKADMNHIANAAVVPIINKSQFCNIDIPLPPLDVQRKIADVLDFANNLIEKRKAQIENLDLLVKSQFMIEFGKCDSEANLSDYVWFQEGPGVRTIDFTIEGTILLTGSNINKNQINFGSKRDRYISYELANGKYKHFMCDKGDILVVSSAIDPDKFGSKVVIVHEDKRYCLNTGIIRFKPNSEYLTIAYFREFLKTNFFKSQVMNSMRGIAQMHFGPSHLNTMKIIVPSSIEQQTQFSDFVSQVEAQKSRLQQSLTKLEENYKSLMQKCFRGEIF